MSAPFVIDPATGQVRFPDLSLDLRPQMPEADFIAATAHLNRNNLGASGDWQRYSLLGMISDDRKLGLYAIFLNERLERASFTYSHKDDTWANWSEEKEAAWRSEYQHELDVQLGGKNEFSWGRVNVIVDSKSGSTDIWIGYLMLPTH